MSQSVLIIDDEADIRVLLKYNLEKEGYLVNVAENGLKGIELAEKFVPDIILLDVMMPDMDGMETCERIKEIETLKHTMICFLTARSEDYSQIAGFDSGADDYITKPIKPKVLISRINALLRRKDFGIDRSKTQEGKIDDSGIAIDREKYKVYKDGNSVQLPRKEFELLSFIMSKPEKVFQRDEIMNKVWGSDVIVGDRTIDVHVRKLRKKLGDKHIETIKGVGYKFNP